MDAGWNPEDETPPAELPPDDFGPVTMHWDRSIPGVLKVVIRGIGGDPEAALRRWMYNFALAREAGLRRILVVLELDGPLIPEPQMARMIAAVATADVGEFRVAIVQTRMQRQSHDELGILIAIEHGISARVFPEEAPALVWLRYGER
ncbi:MAG TPA: hypothetical protein VLM17_06685 [Xanthomonadaceae bacterium]|nr:hypothetical protein [Xanthomonadaceae bacterium]